MALVSPSISAELAREAYGLSELHVAAIIGDVRYANKVLKSAAMSPGGKKKILEARDREGSTPLMTAILCGRLEITKLFLRHGASRKARDHQSRVAREYSRGSLFDRKLRIYQKLGFTSMSRSNSGQHRKISMILRNPAALRSCRRFGNHQFSGSRILKRSSDIVILKPSGEIGRFKPGKKGTDLSNATAGFIASAATSAESTKVEQFAVSGWKPNPGRGHRVLDNVTSTELVREIIHLHGFKVCASRRDNGSQTALPEHKGRFAACHVEKKLAVWWVLRVLKKVLGTSDIARISELRGDNIPAHYKEARLFLDHGPCRDCWDFLDRIKRLTGILICVEQIPFYTKGSRGTGMSRCPNCICEKCGDQMQDYTSPRVVPELSSDLTTPQDDSDESATEPGLSEDGRQPFEDFDLDMEDQDDRGARLPRIRHENNGFNRTAAPENWTVFPSSDPRPVAKPLNRRYKKNEASSRAICDAADPSNGAAFKLSLQHDPASRTTSSSPVSEVTVRTQSVDPVSTIEGHSAYFDNDEHDIDTDGPIGSLRQVSSAPIHPMYRIQQALNLGRFAYEGTRPGAPDSVLSVRMGGTGVDSGKGSTSRARSTRQQAQRTSAIQNKKPKLGRQARREMGFRVRSTFARAVAARSD